MTIRVLLADDHAILRDGLKALRAQLAAWRRTRALKFHIRSIIVVEQVNGGTRRGGLKTRQASA